MTPALWDRYTWQGHDVVVIQQWRDPYGRPMIRVAHPDDEDHAETLPLAAFLKEAEKPSPACGRGLGEGIEANPNPRGPE